MTAQGPRSTEADVTRSENPQKDRSIASISFGALCSAARNARARHPSAAATRPYGTAALRGAAATDPDTRPDQPPVIDDPPPRRNAWSAFGFHEPLSPRRWIKPPQLPGTSHSSPDRAARWGLQVLLPRARRRDPTPLIHRQAGDRLAPAPSGSTARLEHAGTLRLTFVFPQVHQTGSPYRTGTVLRARLTVAAEPAAGKRRNSLRKPYAPAQGDDPASTRLFSEGGG